MNTTGGYQPRLLTEGIHTDPDAGTSDEWYTPRHVIEAARSVLGGIDLDPASCATAQEVVQAGTYYTKEQDGLSLPWYGRVFLNPPYSRSLIAPFTGRVHQAYQSGEIAASVVLVNTGTDTPWGQELLLHYPVCLIRGRETFWNSTYRAGRPGGNLFRHMALYLGPDVSRFAEVFSRFGVVKL